MSVLLNVKNLIVSAELDKSSKILLDDISFEIKTNSSLAIVGESGSGKTTLAMLIMNLASDNIHIEGGNIIFLEEDITNKKIIKYLGKDIVYIPQNGMEFLNPSLTIKSQFIDTLKKNKVNKKDYKKIMNETLKKVGLDNSEEILKLYPFELSGGMAQRVSIAMGIVSNPKLLIADELTNGLDEKAKFEIINLINESFTDTAKVFITHDISLAKDCNQCLVMYKGKIMEKGSAKEVLENPKHPYTLSLINALVENGLKVNFTINELICECAYSSRCPLFEKEKCSKVKLNTISSHQWRCVND